MNNVEYSFKFFNMINLIAFQKTWAASLDTVLSTESLQYKYAKTVLPPTIRIQPVSSQTLSKNYEDCKIKLENLSSSSGLVAVKSQ